MQRGDVLGRATRELDAQHDLGIAENRRAEFSEGDLITETRYGRGQGLASSRPPLRHARECDEDCERHPQDYAG